MDYLESNKTSRVVKDKRFYTKLETLYRIKCMWDV
jgi:hypothetical protein